MTPFLLNLSCAWERAASVTYGPWDFFPGDGALRLHGVAVTPLGWEDLEAWAGDDADAHAWLATFRTDVTDHLAIREVPTRPLAGAAKRLRKPAGRPRVLPRAGRGGTRVQRAPRGPAKIVGAAADFAASLPLSRPRRVGCQWTPRAPIAASLGDDSGR
jgi:hypothetical protein